jgi:NAD-dependent DNA ligase
MNVGYTNINTQDRDNELNCPLCQSDIYVNKYGTDYRCTNDECELYTRTASSLVKMIENVLWEVSDIGK